MEELYYQFNTKNNSFIEVHKSLKDKSIFNNRFMLALFNQRLIAFDPYDLSLSDTAKEWIKEECKKNPWYYLREVLRIPVQGGGFGGGARYKLNLASTAQTFCILNGFDSWSCRPRQNLSTISILAILSWFFLFNDEENKDINILDRHLNNSRLLLLRIKEIIKLLPEYLKPSKLDGTRVLSNTDKGRTNSSKIITSSLYHYSNFDDIDKYFKGYFNFVNDAAFFNKLESIIKRSMHLKVLKIFTGTRNYNGKDIELPVIRRSLTWNDSFYDIDIKSIKELLFKHSPLNIIYIEHSYKDLGLSEEWVEDQRRMMVFDRDDSAFRGEVLLEWKN